MRSLEQVNRAIVQCDRCPELRDYCAGVARTRRRAYIDQEYWGQPVPGFGDPAATIMIVGLAPAAHGANRTGRMFTGDRSGDFLYAALHRTGMANQASATAVDDGLRLNGIYIGAALRCAPPANKPTATQLHACRPFLQAEFDLIQPRVMLCLGAVGYNAALAMLEQSSVAIPRPRPKFAHGAELALDCTTVLCCYHVSQQNTFTGRLTDSMLDDVLARAAALVR